MLKYGSQKVYGFKNESGLLAQKLETQKLEY